MDFPSHTIVTLNYRDYAYTTYTDWVKLHAERYLSEYVNTIYDNYFIDEPDILTVLCKGVHSSENAITLYLCRSLTTDKLVLVSESALSYNSFSKEVHAILRAELVHHLLAILQANLPDASDQLQDVAKAILDANLLDVNCYTEDHIC